MKNFTRKKLALVIGVAAATIAPVTQASIIDHAFFRVHGVVIVWGTNSATGTAPIVSDFVLMNGTSGNAGGDLIAANGRSVITGTLLGAPVANTDGSLMKVINQTSGGVLTDNASTGYLNAADVLTAFGIDNTTDVDLSTAQVKHSFYVASNTAFDIKAIATGLNVTDDFGTLTLANIGYSLTVNSGTATDGAITWGASSQDPSAGGGTGVIAAIDDLGDMSASVQVFDGGQRTASATGTIASQSVRFDAVYTLNANASGAGGYDLSMGTGLIEADVTYTVFVP